MTDDPEVKPERTQEAKDAAGAAAGVSLSAAGTDEQLEAAKRLEEERAQARMTSKPGQNIVSVTLKCLLPQYHIDRIQAKEEVVIPIAVDVRQLNRLIAYAKEGESVSTPEGNQIAFNFLQDCLTQILTQELMNQESSQNVRAVEYARTHGATPDQMVTINVK